MKLKETELEQTFFEPTRTRVGKGVGYIILGLVVLLIFSVFSVGLYRIQTVSNQIAESGPSAPGDPELRSAAGDISDEPKN